MRKTFATVLVTAVIAATLAGRAADAAPKQRPAPPERSDAPPSRDGRVLGYPRTCGHDFFVYSGDGVPVGPYCH